MVALLSLLVGILLLPNLAARSSPDIYRLVIIRVWHPDLTPDDLPANVPSYTMDQLTDAASEMEEFFSWLSYGNLDMRISVTDVTLPQNRDYYWHDADPNRAGIQWAYRTINNRAGGDVYIEDAVIAAARDGFDFTNIDGILVFTPWLSAVDVCVHGIRIEWRSGAAKIFQRAYVYANNWNFGGPSPGGSGVWWNGWAHEIGHQLQHFYGITVGHPSGYKSGYDLMDSCYPCGVSAFTISGPSGKQFLPNWLPADKIVTVEAPPSGTISQTIVLAPLTQDLNITRGVAHAIKVPIASGLYYIVEARRRLRSDSLNTSISHPGIWDEGIQIVKVEESRTETANGVTIPVPVIPIYSCDTLVSGGCARAGDRRLRNCWPGIPRTQRESGSIPDYCWPYPLWHVGDEFYDPVNDIGIKAVAEVGDGYAVTVTRGIPPGHPDVFVLPWLTPPMYTWESVDIWIDSPCNGYEDDVGPEGLRYGRRADGTVIGNGDNPCVGHDNRIYATIRNGGDRPATNVEVTFKVTDPLGVGIRGARGWTVVGTATLANLDPGESTKVYVTWNPAIQLTQEQLQEVIEEDHFSFHSCVQVVITPVADEIVTSNQDGDGEQENIEYFEARLDPLIGQYEPLEREFFLFNDSKEFPRTFYLYVESELPEDWSYSVADGRRVLTLAPRETIWVPVSIEVPPNTPLEKMYFLKVTAFTEVITRNEAVLDYPLLATRIDYLPVAGVILSAQTVVKTSLSLTAEWDGIDKMLVSGCLQPYPDRAKVAVDYTDPQGRTITRLANTKTDGCFNDELIVEMMGTWTVRAIWQGDLRLSSAVSKEVAVEVGPPPTRETIYFSDARESPGSIYRYDLATGSEDIIYTRSRGKIHSFRFHPGALKLYFVNANENNIYQVSFTPTGPSAEEVVYTHGTYIRDIAFVHDEEGQHPGNPAAEWHIYFSEAWGAGRNGKIYRINDDGSITLFYEVNLADVDGFWAGDFAFSPDGTLYLSSGNRVPASIYRVSGRSVKRVFTDRVAPIKGFVFTSSDIVYYANWRSEIHRLDLRTGERMPVYTNPRRGWLSDVDVER
jgi:hypothetical protein